MFDVQLTQNLLVTNYRVLRIVLACISRSKTAKERIFAQVQTIKYVYSDYSVSELTSVQD